jgi:flagellar biosynthetic protein FliQ
VSSPLALALDALYLALRLTLPCLGVAFAVALVVGLVQMLTQLREPVLNGIARMLSVGLGLALSFSAFSGELVSFTARLYHDLPTILAGL